VPRGANLRGNNWAATQSEQPTHAPTDAPTERDTDTPTDAPTDTSTNTPTDTSTEPEEHAMAPSTAELARDAGRRAGESIRTDPASPRRTGTHGHGLLDVSAFTEALTTRWRPVRGASVNVALDAYLSAQLDAYCSSHKVPKRVVVSWLVAELVGKEER
jgi:hypothetical protein